MKITLTSVMVDDQEKALAFYRDILGFVVHKDVPAGEYRWLTLIAPEGPAGVELLLEPMGFPPARTYQRALFDAEIPATSFTVHDIDREYARLKDLGVTFLMAPTRTDSATVAVFDDTCGNFIQLVATPD